MIQKMRENSECKQLRMHPTFPRAKLKELIKRKKRSRATQEDRSRDLSSLLETISQKVCIFYPQIYHINHSLAPFINHIYIENKQSQNNYRG
jgi:hypothetical protein